MHTLPRSLFPLLMLLAAACNGDGPTDEDPQATWEEPADASDLGAMSGVWGSGPDDVYVVGGFPGEGTMMHFDGSEWMEVDVPEGTDLLVWVYGFGPDDVWAVGESGSIIHYDGTAWSTVPSDTDEALWGVFGFAPDDFWIVGGETGAGDPVLMHYDDGTLTDVGVDPTENDRNAKALFKVWGIDDTLFAVGQRGLILEYDGTDWTAVSAGAEANDDFVALWGTSPDNIVAVGGRSNAKLAHYDGTAWTTVTPAGVPGLSAVHMTDPDQVVIGGIGGFNGVASVPDLSVGSETPMTTLDLHAAWGPGDGTHYVVGGRFFDPYEGVILSRTAPDDAPAE